MTTAYLENMLAETINSTFDQVCGKGQNGKGQKAFLVTFSLSVDYEKEEGHRSLEVLYWAPMNYVQVWQREVWNVIPVEELEELGDGEYSVKKTSTGYQKGESPWKKRADHDSSWREAMKLILRESGDNILNFAGADRFWRLVNVRETSIPSTV